MPAGTELLEALPVAVYTTDAEGRISFCNSAAAALWGRRPEIGVERWSGALRMFTAEGRPLAPESCGLVECLRERRPIEGAEILVGRPDGTRVPVAPHLKPLFDESGRFEGVICALVETGHRHAEIEAARLATIVSSSDDAIISKSLDGIVTSWNAGATRIFGYTADEMIGRSIKQIIPPELHDEEDMILGKIQKGERLDHFDTIRVAKDGRRVDISLTVSPLHDKAGRVIGASKISRDVGERKQAEAVERLLVAELDHRVKNMLASIQAIASQSLRRAATPQEFVTSFNARVQAIAQAYDLLAKGRFHGATLAEVVRSQIRSATYGDDRISVTGPSVWLDSRMVMHLAMVFHELVANARRHGALSLADGRVEVGWVLDTDARAIVLLWNERGLTDLNPPARRGFGIMLIEQTLSANGGSSAFRYGAEGLCCEMRLPHRDNAPVLPEDPGSARLRSEFGPAVARSFGKRVLVIEDEPLLALEMEEQLRELGCEVVGPAAEKESARRLIADGLYDAALLDANLAGHRVEDLAVALSERGIPFAFATGYGRDGLPAGYPGVPVLAKPFRREDFVVMISALLSPTAHGAGKKPPRTER